MNTMSNADRDKIKRVINSVYGATSVKFNLEMNDKPKCNYVTTSINNMHGDTFNQFKPYNGNINFASLYPNSLFYNRCVDTEIVSKKEWKIK